MVTPSSSRRNSEGTCQLSLVPRPLLPMALTLLGAVLVVTLSSCAHTSQTATTADSASATAAGAARMVELGAEHGESFLKHSQTKAIRNMLGGARAVFLAPNLTDEAALLGIEHGTGFLLRRHGKEWSDPLFVQFDETSIGYQAGVKESHVLILLMTDEAVNDFVKGTVELGGTGGFAIGDYGLGVSGLGGLHAGLEMIMLSTSKGAFGGGGYAEMKTTLASKLNDEIYGKNASASQILATRGGKYAPAIKLREVLSKMVVDAWE